MNLKMFEHWLEEMFIPYTVHINQPLLLVMDGYSSYVNLLKQNRLVCSIFPPHTTHALQPLDLILFNSVKNDRIKIPKELF